MFGVDLWITLLFRSIQGAAEAASASSIVGILLSMFPNWAASIASFSETSIGLGNTLGNGTFRNVL